MLFYSNDPDLWEADSKGVGNISQILAHGTVNSLRAVDSKFCILLAVPSIDFFLLVF